MDSLNKSTCDGFSFVTIPTGDCASTDFNLDYSILHGVLVDESPKIVENENGSLPESLLNVNRSLLTELKSERMKNEQLTESFVSLKREFEEFKSLAPALDRNESLTKANFNGKQENDCKTLTTGDFVNAEECVKSVSASNGVSIKEGHLVELVDYLQSQLKFCKTEMYAMHSRMTGMAESFKSRKTSTVDTNTQTELLAKASKELSTKANSEETQTCDEDWVTVTTQSECSPSNDLVVDASTKSTSSPTPSALFPCESGLAETRLGDARNIDSNATQRIRDSQVQPALYPSLSERNGDAAGAVFGEALKVCPTCSISFGDETSDEMFASHVNNHYSENNDKKCPVCGVRFNEASQADFEDHVYGHFGEVAFRAHSNFE